MAKVANILFPSDYFEKKQVDEAMRSEHDAAVVDARLDIRLFNLEQFEESGELQLSYPFLDPSLPLIYRGWMMKPVQYTLFFDALRAEGLAPVVQPVMYSEFHMFPLAYRRHWALREHSPLLMSFAGKNVDAEIINGSFSRFMLKDYVKSAKGTDFPQFFETPVSQERMDEIVSEFVLRRGELFTEGIVCKEYVELARYDGFTNEWRAFYLGGAVLNLSRNSNQPTIAPTPPDDLIGTCANFGSPYYTVDFAERIDGDWIVVETGDGQVSGLAVAQDPVVYYQVLADVFESGFAADEPNISRIMTSPTGTAALTGDPLPGWTVEDMRAWLDDDPSDTHLADAFALTHAKEGFLVDLSDDDASFDNEHNAWRVLHKELTSKIYDKQRAAGLRFDTSFGTMASVYPFMVRNRYVDACGWWVKRDEQIEVEPAISITNTLLSERERGLLASLVGRRLDTVTFNSMFECIPDRSWDDAAFEVMELAFGEERVLLTNAEEVVEDFGGASEDVAAFHVGRRKDFGHEYWFFGNGSKARKTLQIDETIEDILVIEEREQHGAGADADCFYSYTKAVCFVFEGGKKLLCYRLIWFGEEIKYALGSDAMNHLPPVGDEVDWDEEEGFWVRRATVSLRNWPDAEVIEYDGRHAR